MQKNKVIFSLLFIVSSFVNAQTVQSPEQFLGYKIGTKYTRHHKIVEYFKAIASAKSDMVVLDKYGETNEGRELLLTYISTPENIQKLNAIQQNNLRLAGLSKDKMAAISTNAPAIVWLSYNVHGNEPSSSEAAMQTLFALVDPTNTQIKEWLKNTIVIIDPCLNPDGRDRYVNWYNQMMGKELNADPQSREHNEPWPGGRSNHYNFDLNRDWAWQTQVETQQRIKKYNQWMPHVHVDFHEQGINEPYYFAPAAEPFHEVITPWQRSFQTQIGRNHAKYFDANGWLYFTKERFDLFYPSYGDTYPIYNGSIGMTYEQGGHSRGGLGIVTDDGDTLTLVDRVMHHFTTGISTIEVASTNAQLLITEFKKYFEDGINAKNTDYKTYVLSSNDVNKLNAVKALLANNKIDYTNIAPVAFKAYNYQTEKEEDIKTSAYAIAVSAYQPKSALVKVLLEPKSKLVDSATYDITAWSVPLAFGVDGFALKEKKVFDATAVAEKQIATTTTNYGFIIPYTSFNSAKCLAFLLKQNIKVRFSEKPFEYKNQQYDRGTLVVIKTGNNLTELNKTVANAVEQFKITAIPVETGFMDKGVDFGSPDIKLIQTPKVVLLTGDGVSSTAAGEVWNLFDQQLNYPLTLLNANDIGRTNLKNYQVIIMPDGYYKSLNDKSVNDKLKEFVRNGGKLIALEDAVNQLASADWGFKKKEDSSEKKDDKESTYSNVKIYADRERDYLPNYTPGSIYKVQLDNSHPLAFGYTGNYYTLKQNTAIYEFMKDGWNVGILKKDNYVTGFSGYKAKEKLKDGMVIGTMEMGNGVITVFADNPIFRLFWESGKLLFVNAIFMVGNQ
jgi:hypothetical protein